MAVDVRAARIREAEQAGDLVEAFPAASSSVVPTTSILRGMSSTCSSGGVAAGDDQSQRVLGERAELQLSDGDVPDHMLMP